MRSTASVPSGSGSSNKIAYWTGTSTLSYNTNLHYTGTSLGIGTSSPSTYLHVNHPNSSTNGLSISNSSNSTYRWALYVASSDQSFRLYYDGSYRGGFNSTTGAYTSTSDKRLKKNIRKTNSLLDKVMNLEVVEYNFIKQKDDKTYLGLIAQDVEKLFPSLVSFPIDSSEGESFYTLDYSATGVIAIKAIQEQQVIINNQQNTIENLKTECSQLKSDHLELKKEIELLKQSLK
jgi:hypothetical protein